MTATPATAQSQAIPTIEWAPFTLAEGVDEAALLAASEALQRDFLSKQRGFLHRELLKQGHRGALALLGYAAETAISMASLQLNQTRVRMGEDLIFFVEIQSTADAPQNLMIDYIVHHRKANGKLAPKVFKLAKKRLGPRETLSLTKRHAFRPLSTRVYYPGCHALELQINGQRWGWKEFELLMER